MHVVVLYLKSTKKISVGYEKLIIGAPFTQQVQLCCTRNFKRFWPILCSKFNRILHFFVAGPPLDVAKFRGPGPWPYELGWGKSRHPLRLAHTIYHGQIKKNGFSVKKWPPLAATWSRGILVHHKEGGALCIMGVELPNQAFRPLFPYIPWLLLAWHHVITRNLIITATYYLPAPSS